MNVFFMPTRPKQVRKALEMFPQSFLGYIYGRLKQRRWCISKEISSPLCTIHSTFTRKVRRDSSSIILAHAQSSQNNAHRPCLSFLLTSNMSRGPCEFHHQVNSLSPVAKLGILVLSYLTDLSSSGNEPF